MKSITLQKPEHLELFEIAPPTQPNHNEALVRVHTVGICGTDLHAYKGRQPYFSYPRTLGHELGCEVVALGSTNIAHGLKVGDYCAVEPYLNCGTCIACRRGKSNCCTHIQVLGVHINGGMQESLIVPIHKLHPSPTLSLEQLALVEPLCIGAHAVRRAQLEPGEYVLVIGAGPIGLAAIQFAQLAGAKVIVMEISDRRLQFCQTHLGVELLVDAKQDPLPQLQKILGEDLPTAVFEATGNAQSMMNSVQFVAHGGKLIFISVVQNDLTFSDPELHKRELTLLRSRNATSDDFIEVIKTLEAGKIDLTSWITHRTSPEEIVTQFPTWFDPENGVVKAVLVF